MPIGGLPCRRCGQKSDLLVRGECCDCAPVRHANYRRAYDAVTAMIARFERATGKPALSHWYEFEAFVETQPDWPRYAEILRRDSTDEPLEVGV